MVAMHMEDRCDEPSDSGDQSRYPRDERSNGGNGHDVRISAAEARRGSAEG